MNSATVDIMIQARMGSSRLPGKVLKKIGPIQSIEMMIRRVSGSRRARGVFLLIPDTAGDDELADALETIINKLRTENAVGPEITVFRGAENDLISRYLQAARIYESKIIVRLTGDCPFIDPELIDRMLDIFIFNWPRIDFMTNCLQRTFARGLDIEIMSIDLLKQLDNVCFEKYQREHVVPYVEDNMDRFRTLEYPNCRDDSHYRLTLDTDDDLRTLESVYSKLNRLNFTYKEMIETLANEPMLIQNESVHHKAYTE